MLIVITPISAIASLPSIGADSIAQLPEDLLPSGKMRHFYSGKSRHFKFVSTATFRIICIMSNCRLKPNRGKMAPKFQKAYPLSVAPSIPFCTDSGFHLPAVKRTMPYDLFGEIPVTEDEVSAWVSAVAPRWLYPERSFRSYVRTYDVPAKIRAAKAAGTFFQTIEKPRHAWHARLSLDAVL